MSRILTTYSRPPLATLLRTAATIEDVGKLRASIIQGLRSGKIEASDKTKESWDAALWESVHRIMRERPREAPYVFNFVLTWPKSARFEAELRAYLEALVRPLPSDHELYLAELRAREIAARETRFVGEIPIKFEITEEGRKFFESIPIGPGPYGRGEEPTDAPDLTRSPDRSKPDDTNR